MAAADDFRIMLATSDDILATADKSSPCFLCTYDDEVITDNFGGSKQLVRRMEALVCADDFPNLKKDDRITVNGTLYSVLSTRLIQDGHVLMINLKIVKGL